MTLSRRTFTFASLVAALTPAAARATPAPGVAGSDATLIPEVQDAPPPVALRVKASARVEDGKVSLTLQVTNEGEDTDLLVAQGSRPAGELRVFANVSGARVELEPAVEPVDRREMMSRMGPIPRYQALKRYETVALGPYRYQVPEAGARKVDVEGTLWATSGPVLVRAPGLSVDDRRSGA